MQIMSQWQIYIAQYLYTTILRHRNNASLQACGIKQRGNSLRADMAVILNGSVRHLFVSTLVRYNWRAVYSAYMPLEANILINADYPVLSNNLQIKRKLSTQ